MLTFASNKKRPGVLSEAGLMGDLISPVSLVAGTRNRRYRRNENGDPEGSPVSGVAGPGNTRCLQSPFLRLIERNIPKLAA